MTIVKGTNQIRCLNDWEKYGGPKSRDHWKVDRSAMELARAWLAAIPGLPSEVDALIVSHQDFGSVVSWSAEPEAKVRFDQFPGGPCNMDLLVRAVDCGGAYVIAVEAKADECFGETIGDALANAVERKLMNPSNGIVRIEQLAAALLGPKKNGEAPLRTLRYQLFTAAAGVLAEARRKSVGRAVLLVHEFFTLKTLDAKHQENARDLNRFVHRLSHGQFPIVQAGILYGPIRVPDSPLFTQVPDLYIGKAVRHLRVPLCLPSVSHSP